jgi:mannosyl-3-phosphoglycerate phosphatase
VIRAAVFTDLDGTLLDAQSFAYEPAFPVLRRARAAGVRIVPVTSKTLAEVAALAEELQFSGPLIIESGGGVARRTGDGWDTQVFGIDIERLRALAPEIESRSASRLRLFSAMSVDEAARVSGLTGEALERSRERRFDEPFCIEEGSLSRIARAAEDLGLRVREGGRFHHLCGPVGKGEAVRRVRDELESELGSPLRTIALGDAPMDAEFLLEAERAVIIPRPDGTAHPDLLSAVPHARVAPHAGPAGWAAAVDEWMTEILQ